MTPTVALLLGLAWASRCAASPELHMDGGRPHASNHSQLARGMRSTGGGAAWLSRLARGDSQEVAPPFWANRGRREEMLELALADLIDRGRGTRGGKGSEELPPFWANRGRREGWSTLEELRELLANQEGDGQFPTSMSKPPPAPHTPHVLTAPLTYLNQLRGNGSHGRPRYMEGFLPRGPLRQDFRERSLDETGPFWANRGRREGEDEALNPFWANRGRREGEDEALNPFWANRGRREGDEFGPFWANRGRREGDEFGPFWANRGRREGEDFGPFWANRGRREGDEFGPFWANRGRREGDDIGPFWANRGRREGEEFGPFWANRGRREEEEEEAESPVRQYRGHREDTTKDHDGEEPFWANRGRREEDEEGPFWANRGRSAGLPSAIGKRDRKEEPLYADEPQYVLMNRRDGLSADFLTLQPIPYWIARGKRQSEQARVLRGLKDSLSHEEQPFWPTRGRRGLKESLSTEEPFWALRGRRGLREALSKEDPFWAIRGRRSNLEALNNEELLWTLRGKKSNTEVVGRGRRVSAGSSSVTRALGVDQNQGFWPVRGKKDSEVDDDDNEQDEKFWDTLEKKTADKIRTGNSTHTLDE